MIWNSNGWGPHRFSEGLLMGAQGIKTRSPRTTSFCGIVAYMNLPSQCITFNSLLLTLDPEWSVSDCVFHARDLNRWTQLNLVFHWSGCFGVDVPTFASFHTHPPTSTEPGTRQMKVERCQTLHSMGLHSMHALASQTTILDTDTPVHGTEYMCKYSRQTTPVN